MQKAPRNLNDELSSSSLSVGINHWDFDGFSRKTSSCSENLYNLWITPDLDGSRTERKFKPSVYIGIYSYQLLIFLWKIPRNLFSRGAWQLFYQRCDIRLIHMISDFNIIDEHVTKAKRDNDSQFNPTS